LVHIASTSFCTTISTHSSHGIHKILIIQGWIRNRLFGQAQKKKNSNYQHYNILSAYELKDETSTSSTYVSLEFYCMDRSRKILVKKNYRSFFQKWFWVVLHPNTHGSLGVKASRWWLKFRYTYLYFGFFHLWWMFSQSTFLIMHVHNNCKWHNLW
jgi:hypothetical protein